MTQRHLQHLTERQIQVWKMVASSFTAKDIAFKLGVKPKTVEFHRRRLMGKLNVFDVAGLTRRAIKIGLVKC